MTPSKPTEFFAHVRTELFRSFMAQTQVDGINAILAACPDDMDLHKVAYILATAYHETGQTMEPISEWGRGQGRPYGAPCGPYQRCYYGRGLVQLTWLKNYERADLAIPGSDLVRNPDNALTPAFAAEILVHGMTEGWFTGQRLADHFDGPRSDWTGARKIINGQDKAAQIAGYAVHFFHALNHSPAP